MEEKDVICFLDDAELASEELGVSVEEYETLLLCYIDVNIEHIPNDDYWGWQF